jgi:flagellar biosynthesis protein FlhB
LVAKAKRCKGSYSVFLRAMALIFAVFFILLGILGFIPPITPNHFLFNFFTVALLLNIFYILTGLIALSASGSFVYSRLYFKIFGVIYAGFAIWGFAMNGSLSLVHVQLSDSFFYLLTAIIALYLGFTSKLPRSYAL